MSVVVILRNVIIFIAAVSIVALDAGPVDATAPVPLYVFAGQSNMVGSAAKAAELPARSPTLSAPQSNALFWGPTSDAPRDWLPLQAPTEVWQSAVRAGFGPEISAAKRLTALNGGRQIAIFKFAKSSTDLATEWNPYSPLSLYDRMMSRLKIAKRKLAIKTKRPVRIAGFFWMQGESDASSKQKAYYYGRNLKKFIAKLRSDTGVADLPVVMGQILDIRRWYKGFPYSELVRWRQYEVAYGDPRVFLVSTHGLTQDLLSKAHLDTEGTINLGSRMVQSRFGLS